MDSETSMVIKQRTSTTDKVGNASKCKMLPFKYHLRDILYDVMMK